MASYWSLREPPRGVASAVNANFAPVTAVVERMRASRRTWRHRRDDRSFEGEQRGEITAKYNNSEEACKILF